MSLFQETLDSYLNALYEEDLGQVDPTLVASDDAKKKSLAAAEAEKKLADLKAQEALKKAELAKQRLQSPGHVE